MKNILTPKETEYIKYLVVPRTTKEFMEQFDAKENAVWQLLRTLRLKGNVIHDSGKWRIVDERPPSGIVLTPYQREVLQYLHNPHKTTELMEEFTKTYQSAIQVIRTLRLMELVESAGRCDHPAGRCFAWIATHKGRAALGVI